MNKLKNQPKEWYKKPWGVIAAFLLLPFFAIWYAWAKSNWSKNARIGITAASLLFVLIALAISPNTTTQTNLPTAPQANNIETPVEEKSPQEKIFESIEKLISTRQAFDTGSYVKGDIPKGEYAFVSFEGSGKYYSEEDSAGNIIDNENFDSFGYVYVHGVGNLETEGVLIKSSSFKKLGVKGAKEIYEKLNSAWNYKGSAWYKVGSDIKSGQYTIQSTGEAYVAIMSGPVGDNTIIDNNNFNGKYTVGVSVGQYLVVSRGEIK